MLKKFSTFLHGSLRDVPLVVLIPAEKFPTFLVEVGLHGPIVDESIPAEYANCYKHFEKGYGEYINFMSVFQETHRIEAFVAVSPLSRPEVHEVCVTVKFFAKGSKKPLGELLGYFDEKHLLRSIVRINM